MDLDCELASEPGERGRHPLPDLEGFQAAARRAGIGPDTLVVAYDEAAEGGAARLWWLLRHFGHERVAVLDGGLRGWRRGLRRGGDDRRAGRRRTSSRPIRGQGSRRDDYRRGGGAGPSVLLDARAPERYRGELEPIDPVAGHIPGAANLPFAALAPEGRFLAPEELRSAFEAAGVAPGRELVAYCGSGVTACVVLLAAEVAGLGPGASIRLLERMVGPWAPGGARLGRSGAIDPLSRRSGPGGVRGA